MKKTKLGTNTNLIRGGLNRSQFNETSEALFLTSGFVYDSAEQAEAIFKGSKKGFQYTRYSNPTVEIFEKRLALLDGSEDCFATASGMAAVFFSLMCQLKAGDHLVSSSALFGSCKEIVKNILPRYGIEVTFIDGATVDVIDCTLILPDVLSEIDAVTFTPFFMILITLPNDELILDVYDV